jgi:CheY-like chemotaxis protein
VFTLFLYCILCIAVGFQSNAKRLPRGAGGGLGLWVSKGIVAKHAGMLTGKSEGLNKGAEFTVYLPTYGRDAFPKTRKSPKFVPPTSPNGEHGGGFFKSTSILASAVSTCDDNDENTASNNCIGKNINTGGCGDNSSSQHHGKLSRLRPTSEEELSRSLQITLSEKVPEAMTGPGYDIHMNRQPASVASSFGGHESQNDSVDSSSLCVTTDCAARMPSRHPDFLHVLIVDDVPMNRKILARLLSGIGYMCYQAVDGLDCVDLVTSTLKGYVNLTPFGTTAKPEHVESVHFDLIIMDYSMPRMNGAAATKALRKMGLNIPIFGLTGNVLKDDVDDFLANGANGVLKKPFDVNQFNNAIRNVKGK